MPTKGQGELDEVTLSTKAIETTVEMPEEEVSELTPRQPWSLTKKFSRLYERVIPPTNHSVASPSAGFEPSTSAHSTIEIKEERVELLDEVLFTGNLFPMYQKRSGKWFRKSTRDNQSQSFLTPDALIISKYKTISIQDVISV